MATEFKVGDRVVVREYSFQGPATITHIRPEFYLNGSGRRYSGAEHGCIIQFDNWPTLRSDHAGNLPGVGWFYFSSLKLTDEPFGVHDNYEME